MQTLQNDKAANEKSVWLTRTGKNKTACDGDSVVGFDGAGQPQKAGLVVRMGREVSNKKASDSEKDAKCLD